MSEIKGVKPPQIEQGKISLKGIRSVETTNAPEKKVSPLREAGNLLRLALSIDKRAESADKWLIHKDIKETGEKEKNFRFRVRGNLEVMKLLRGEASEEEWKDSKGNKRKIAILAEGGAQAGANGAGYLLAMQEKGAWDRVDAIFGDSAGAANAAYIASGQGEEAKSIYWEENCDGAKFVKLPEKPLDKLKALKDAYENGSEKPIVDTDYV